MGVRPRSGDGVSKSLERHGKLMVTRRGVYMVRGDRKLKNIQLISWDQLLGPAPGVSPDSVLHKSTPPES